MLSVEPNPPFVEELLNEAYRRLLLVQFYHEALEAEDGCVPDMDPVRAAVDELVIDVANDIKRVIDVLPAEAMLLKVECVR